MSFLIVMVLLLVVMYVLMIRPQRQRQRDHQSLIEGAGVGDDILTTGGIYGTITRAEGDDVVVSVAGPGVLPSLVAGSVPVAWPVVADEAGPVASVVSSVTVVAGSSPDPSLVVDDCSAGSVAVGSKTVGDCVRPAPLCDGTVGSGSGESADEIQVETTRTTTIGAVSQAARR